MSDFKAPNKTHNTLKNRDKSNIIVGLRAMSEAIAAGKEFDKVLIQKGLKGDQFLHLKKQMSDHGISYQLVPQEKLDRITRANHQGVIAFTSPIEFANMEAIVTQLFEQGESPKLLLLDEVTDVRNFGAICRTAECLGFHAVILPDKGSAAINADAVKTSAGALMHLPVCRVKSLRNAVDFLKQSGLQLIAASEKSSHTPDSLDLQLPVCIIMGSEERGVHPDLLKTADHLVRIPMSGRTSSLNVSVAAGILMYEVNRQRSQS